MTVKVNKEYTVLDWDNCDPCWIFSQGAWIILTSCAEVRKIMLTLPEYCLSGCVAPNTLRCI